jgi:hypothetical protein
MFHIGYIGYVDVASLYQDREISNSIIPSPIFMKSVCIASLPLKTLPVFKYVGTQICTA